MSAISISSVPSCGGDLKSGTYGCGNGYLSPALAQTCMWVSMIGGFSSTADAHADMASVPAAVLAAKKLRRFIVQLLVLILIVILIVIVLRQSPTADDYD